MLLNMKHMCSRNHTTMIYATLFDNYVVLYSSVVLYVIYIHSYFGSIYVGTLQKVLCGFVYFSI